MIRRRTAVMLGAATLAAALAGAGCKNAPSTDQCNQLLDHLVDLEFKKAGATASESTKAELAKAKTAVAEATGPAFLKQCTENTARSRVECALHATDVDNGVAKCDDTK